MLFLWEFIKKFVQVEQLAIAEFIIFKNEKLFWQNTLKDGP